MVLQGLRNVAVKMQWILSSRKPRTAKERDSNHQTEQQSWLAACMKQIEYIYDFQENPC